MTTLGDLRDYRAWTDGGQTGEDPFLIDELEVTIRADGSVGVSGGAGVLLYAGDVDLRWARWLVERRLVPDARCWVLQETPGPDGELWAHSACGLRWIGTNGDPIEESANGFEEMWALIVEEGQEVETE